MIIAHAEKGNANFKQIEGFDESKVSQIAFGFQIEDINDAHRLVDHAQRMIPYPVTRRKHQASMDFREQTEHNNDTKYDIEH